jgi:hypothetical protein
MCIKLQNIPTLFFLFTLCAWGQQARAQEILVYPGDVTNNGVVNNIDFLYLGLGYNFIGPPRVAPAGNPQSFTPQPATPWPFILPNGANMAHADCNGDGIVNYFYDAFPIYVNYRDRRTDIPVVEDVFNRGVKNIDPPLRFNPSGVPNNLQSGSTFTMPIELGSAAIPAEDLYGIAFSVFFDSAFINTSSANFDFSQLSWANPDNDRVYMHRMVNSNRVDVSWTRTDHNQRSGFGAIGTAEFIIIIDVIGFQEFKIAIDSIKMLDKYGNETLVAGDTVTINVAPEALSSDNEPKAQPQMQVQPNPASDRLWVFQDAPMEVLILWDALGRPVQIWYPNANQVEVLLPDLPAGLYLLESRSKQGSAFRKIQIQP